MLYTRKRRIMISKEKVTLLIQSIINSKKIVDINAMKEYLKTSYPENTIEYCNNMYGLEISDTIPFIIWPVFMSTVADNINICSVNYGALTLFDDNTAETNNQIIKEYINAAVNVLVVTNIKKDRSDQVFRYWPTSIDYTNKNEWGTINQVSLSLTSLYKFGFLDKKSILSDSPLDRNTRLNRFRFFAENLNWILSSQNTVSDECAAWSYAENCKEVENENDIITAITPSQFCYELVARLYDYFVSCEENKRIIDDIDPNLLKKMSTSCQYYENWIANTQKEDGGYGRNNNSSTSLFAHSCCAMLTYVYNNKNESENSDVARLNRLISYLIKNYNNFIFEISDISDSFKFQYEVDNKKGYVNDIYEIFPETLFLINCCKNINDDKNKRIKWYYKRRLRVMNYRAYEKLFSRLEMIQINNTQSNLVVKGRQLLSRTYPIYALYYTKICLQRLENNDELSLKSRKKYISLPLIMNPRTLILFIVLMICVLVSYFIDPSTTLITILLSAATFIASMFLPIFHKKRK